MIKILVFALLLSLILLGQVYCQDKPIIGSKLCGGSRLLLVYKKYDYELNQISLALSNKSKTDSYFSFLTFNL